MKILDAACFSSDTKTYWFFRDNRCWSKKTGENVSKPYSISNQFSGLPNDLDAACFSSATKTYWFFKGSQCWSKKTGESVSKSYNISNQFSGLPNDLDAACFSSATKTYWFFKGSQCWSKKTGEDVSKPYNISNQFSGLPNDLDSACFSSVTKTYWFFKGGQCWSKKTGEDVSKSYNISNQFSGLPDTSEYKIVGEVSNFIYPDASKIILNNAKIIPLTIASHTFNNPTDATLSQNIKDKVTKEESYTWSFQQSEFLNCSNNMKINVKANASFLGIGNLHADATSEQKWEFSKNFEEKHSKTINLKKEYQIEQVIHVPSHTNIKAVSQINWLSEVKIPFKAKLELVGYHDKNTYADDPTNNKMLKTKELKEVLENRGYHDVHEGEYSLTVDIVGDVTCDAGIDTTLTTENI